MQRVQEQGTIHYVAKAVDLTHKLSRMPHLDLDTVLRAMDTQQSGGGTDWIATGFDPTVVMDIALDRQVSSLFERIPMPDNPDKFPIVGGDPTAYVTPENAADTGQTSVKFPDAGTAGVTFTAKKVSVSGLARLLEEGAVQTMEKFGQNATGVTSILERVDGMPVIVSEYVRDALNATGVYDGTTRTKTQFLIVYRPAFAIGDRLSVQLEAEREAKYGQDVLIARERIDFQPWYSASANNLVGMVYNISRL